MQTKFDHFSDKIKSYVLALIAGFVAAFVFNPEILLVCKVAFSQAYKGVTSGVKNASYDTFVAAISILKKIIIWQDIVVFLAVFFVSSMVFSWLYQKAAEQHRKAS